MNRHTSNRDLKAILSMWTAWAVTSGAFTAVAVLSLWITRIWLPIVTFTLGLGLYLMVRRILDTVMSRCYVLPWLGIWVLGFSGVAMAVIDLINTPALVGHNPVNSAPGVVPYLGALVVYPIAAAVFAWGSWRRFKLSCCADCRMRFGMPSERGTVATIFCQEGIYQRRLMTWLTAVMAVVAWTYYFVSYINVSLSKADVYIFVGLPLLGFVFAVVFMGIRYLSIYFYYDRDISGGLPSDNGITTVRYIIICGNEFFIHVPEPGAESITFTDKADTPAMLRFPWRSSVGLSDARHWFLNMNSGSRNTDLEVRFMYSGTSVNGESNMFHYLVFASSREAIESGTLQGEWFSIYEIQKILRAGMCSNLLGAEISRLHTIAMAWKTYNREGKRLYKIRNYTPTFRVSDIHKWDVDYNDPHWLYVSLNNEDKPMYRFRRFWRKYISGINE